MRTFLKVIAWIGLGFMAIGTIASFWIWMALISHDPGPQPTFGPSALWIYILPIDILGLLFVFIGGFLARPRYLWLASISVGLLHILVSVPPEQHFIIEQMHLQGIYGLIANAFVLPGLLAILLGILLLILNMILSRRK
ncbi:MAG: hypothetical protein PHR56_01630 [Dehalococcoidales bacterium]|nr:hypothetical protein [Dehalococcoidales bacterium]